MRLLCFTTSGAPPKIVPAPLERQWMDDTPNAFAYRCLPLNIANAHGWMILNTVPFIAEWNGGPGLHDIKVTSLTGEAPIASSHFGSGVLTFTIHGLFRTEPGFDLMASGPTNMPKDAIQALTGVIETDWSPFSFTMNWKFTRASTPVSFAADEPFCLIFPIQRGLIEQVEPEFLTFESDIPLQEAYTAWAESRNTFNQDLQKADSEARAKLWQKEYFQGHSKHVTAPRDHRTKLRAKPFAKALRWPEGGLMDQLVHEQTVANETGRRRMTEGVLTPGLETVRITAQDDIDPEALDFVFEPHFLTPGECAVLAPLARRLTARAAAEDATLDDQIALFRVIARENPEAAALMRDIQQRVLTRLGSFYELRVPLFTDAVHLMCLPEGAWMDPRAIRAVEAGEEQISIFRDFASVIYLNDDHDGGEIYFPRLNLVVKPGAGMLIGFTGGWHHEYGVTEVTSGHQWTMPAFHTFHRSRRDLDLETPRAETVKT